MSKIKDLEFLRADRKNDVKGFVCKTKSLTEQQWKDSQDINLIIKKCVGIGRSSEDILSYLASLEAQSQRYLDVSNVTSLEELQYLMDEAHSSFIDNVPATIRDKFDNDAMKFYQAYQKDPKGISELFQDLNNYSVPNASEVEEAPHVTADTKEKE